MLIAKIIRKYHPTNAPKKWPPQSLVDLYIMTLPVLKAKTPTFSPFCSKKITLASWLKDNLIRLYDAPTSTGFGTPMILSGHQRRAGVDGVLALVALQGQVVSAGRDGRIIVWKDGNQAPQPRQKYIYTKYHSSKWICCGEVLGLERLTKHRSCMAYRTKRLKEVIANAWERSFLDSGYECP